jgi:subtilase family serine protease
MLLSRGIACGDGRRVLPGHVPGGLKSLHAIGRLPPTNRIHLSLALPLRDRDILTNLLAATYDPSSANYRHYLTPGEFARRFGPAENDYEALIQFAQTNGLEIIRRHDNRLLLHVAGQVSDVERAFQVTLRTYPHPTEPREFFAPDAEPSVDARLAVLSILGLDNLATLRSALHTNMAGQSFSPAVGSGQGGSFLGGDFKRAYAPGTTLNGAGQMLGLVEFDGYDPTAIADYEQAAGLPSVRLVTVLLDGATGAVSTNFIAVHETEADIEMAVAMATGLTAVVVFEAPDSLPLMGNGLSPYFGDVLGAMVSSNQIKQFSSSWGYEGSPNPNAAYDQIFLQMALQGQSFFEASGDADAWVNPIWVPAASPYLTCVGATTLSMNGSGASYASETIWNAGNEGTEWGPNSTYSWGSGGGVSTNYAIPSYQVGVNMTTNHGSTVFRNIPDVTMVGDNVWAELYDGSGQAVSGTSLSTPLWAAFAALANQQAVSNGAPPVGFINPAIYAIGKSSNYASCFHDVVNGNNTGQISATNYYAVPGFDLCAGWGSPTGTNLINALTPPPEPLQINPGMGFVSTGYVGGPFTISNESLTLSNLARTPLPWSLVNTSSWLSVTPNGGTLPAAGTTNVTAALTAGALALPAGQYTAMVCFSNHNDGVTQQCQFTLGLALPPACAPAFRVVTFSNQSVCLTWGTLAGLNYQLQYATDLLHWSNLGTAFTATNTSASQSDPPGSDPQRFYRLVVRP